MRTCTNLFPWLATELGSRLKQILIFSTFFDFETKSSLPFLLNRIAEAIALLEAKIAPRLIFSYKNEFSAESF